MEMWIVSIVTAMVEKYQSTISVENGSLDRKQVRENSNTHWFMGFPVLLS